MIKPESPESFEPPRTSQEPSSTICCFEQITQNGKHFTMCISGKDAKQQDQHEQKFESNNVRQCIGRKSVSFRQLWDCREECCIAKVMSGRCLPSKINHRNSFKWYYILSYKESLVGRPKNYLGEGQQQTSMKQMRNCSDLSFPQRANT